MNQDTRELWRRGLSFGILTGLVVGVLWWLLAPGGAFYGKGTDATIWLPRDAVLGILLALAGVFSAVVTMRRSSPGHSAQGSAAKQAVAPMAIVILAVSGLVGSVVAWRMGVFAGDLFQTPPDNMPNPSIVFSLRSGPLLLVWPLLASVVLFVWSLVSYAFVPSPDETLHTTAEANG
ncbi:hypothetical protein [Arthrobacter sp. TWP1-1]|uniref:hypothetical protein n=1 Tax=Arthrobacter sp. TWP1-1 TaxID=2804568 RepID=UPI003CE70283